MVEYKYSEIVITFLGVIRVITDWHRAIQQVHQIQEETSNKKIHDQLVVAGMGKTSKASEPRVA